MLAPARRAACATAIVLAACSGSRDRTPSAPPPRAEFLLSSADSTFWVATTSGAHARARRAARPRPVRRDGSSRSMAPTTTARTTTRCSSASGCTGAISSPATARSFSPTRPCRASPASTPAPIPTSARSSPDEEGEANPVDVGDRRDRHSRPVRAVPVVRVSRRRERPGAEPVALDAARRARPAIGQGAVVARSVRPRARRSDHGDGAERSYQTVRDSIVRTRASMRPDERRAADALEQRQFDERGFTLSDDGRVPTITFSVPGRGAGAVGNAVELEPIDGDSTGWWRSLATTLPTTDDAGNDRWTGTGYRVLARYDTSGDVAHVSIADSASREWPVATAARAAASHRLARPSGGGRRRATGAHPRVQPGRDVRPHDARRGLSPLPLRRSLEPPARRPSCASSRPSTKAGTKRPS